MLIKPISAPNFQKRVPLSEYRGVILKLTEQEKLQISKLMSEKSLLEIQLAEVDKMLLKKKTIIASNPLNALYTKIEAEIKELEKRIRQIKIDRKNAQTESLSKL